MPPAKQCPSPDDLRSFLLGQVEDADLARIQDHLSSCGSCLELIANLKAEDTLLAAMQAQTRSAGPDPEGSVVEALMDRLIGVPSPASRASQATTGRSGPSQVPAGDAQSGSSQPSTPYAPGLSDTGDRPHPERGVV
ncbi:MAG: hypothetical protein HY000_04530 [Planctomycetes bacterium]|nr:hypothetical protein [Planctomycetota bacterium]